MKIDKINLAKYNPRKISENELNKLKKSIKEFTPKQSQLFRLIKPIIINKKTNNLIAGHQRIKALKELKQDEIHNDDIRFINLENEQKEKILNISLNKISGEWDIVKLKDLFIELDTGDLDLNLTGFDFDELELILVDDISLKNYSDYDNKFVSEDGKRLVKKTIQCPHCNKEIEL